MLRVVGFDHITITVSNLRVSEAFYGRVMKFFHIRKVLCEYGFVGWANEHFKFYLSEAEVPYRSEKFTKQRPGLNHFSFRAEEKEDIDRFHVFLKKQKIEVAVGPMILKQLGKGMYYIGFYDPDGIKVEFGYPFDLVKKAKKRI
jgi:catechol 2,3-dioxygenase-like lactoylglutathione lyase family enzyme